MRSLALIAVVAAFGLTACGGNDNSKGSSSSTPATTAGTTTTSAKPAEVNAACKAAFPAAGKLNAEYVYDNVVPQANKIATVADQAGEQAFARDMRAYGQEQAAIDRAARDPKPLARAAAAARAEASRIGATACVRYVDAYRKVTAAK